MITILAYIGFYLAGKQLGDGPTYTSWENVCGTLATLCAVIVIVGVAKWTWWGLEKVNLPSAISPADFWKWL